MTFTYTDLMFYLEERELLPAEYFEIETALEAHAYLAAWLGYAPKMSTKSLNWMWNCAPIHTERGNATQQHQHKTLPQSSPMIFTLTLLTPA